MLFVGRVHKHLLLKQVVRVRIVTTSFKGLSVCELLVDMETKKLGECISLKYDSEPEDLTSKRKSGLIFLQ
jgi:hypothetical protein